MANKRPDIYEHNNPDLAFVDSDFVRGARRQVASRAGLYALASKADQLKENVTIVRILSDADNGGVSTEVLLVDDSAIGSAAGWELYSTGSAGPTPAPGTGSGLARKAFSRDVTQAGANIFDLPDGYDDVYPSLQVQQASAYPERPVRPLLDIHCRVENAKLIVSADAKLGVGDTVVGTATSGGGGTGTGGGTSRDFNNVPQSVQDAVTDPSHTWLYGDLTSYGTDDLRTAALDGVVKSDYFDAYEQGSTVDAYRYCYCGQNDGTLGWTRLNKLT